MSVRSSVRAAAKYHFTARPARIKLDQNESPYDLSPELKAAVFDKLQQLSWNRYSELAAESLRSAIARFHDWDEAGVVVSGGSNVLIQAYVAACGLEQRVLTVKPTFAVYAEQARLLAAPLTEIPLTEDFSLPLPLLERELQAGPGVFFLANPAAPTGNVHPRAEIAALLQAARPDWTVVIDEAYHQFSATDLLPLIRQHPHSASLRTFSKAFGLGGVRLGYTLTHPEIAENIQKMLLPFSVSALQVATGLTVLEHADEVRARAQATIAERKKVQNALAALKNVTVYPSQTNFLLFKVPDAAAFFAALLEGGILVRRQDHLPGLSGCLRVSMGTPEENDAFIAAATKVSERMLVHG